MVHATVPVATPLRGGERPTWVASPHPLPVEIISVVSSPFSPPRSTLSSTILEPRGRTTSQFRHVVGICPRITTLVTHGLDCCLLFHLRAVREAESCEFSRANTVPSKSIIRLIDIRLASCCFYFILFLTVSLVDTVTCCCDFTRDRGAPMALSLPRGPLLGCAVSVCQAVGPRPIATTEVVGEASRATRREYAKLVCA